MTAPKRRPSAPTDLGKAGKALWKAVVGDLSPGWELDQRERHLLDQACHTADQISDLEAVVASEGVTTTGSRGQSTVHPALVEIRQARLVLLRLLSVLELADPRGDQTATPASAQARKAANARWGRRRQVEERRHG